MTGGFCHKGGTKLSLILIIDAVHDNSFLVKARCPSWEGSFRCAVFGRGV